MCHNVLHAMDDPLERIKDARQAQHRAHRDLMLAVEDAVELGVPKSHIATAMGTSRMGLYRLLDREQDAKQEEGRSEPPPLIK